MLGVVLKCSPRLVFKRRFILSSRLLLGRYPVRRKMNRIGVSPHVPDYIRPTLYDLLIEPDLESGSFFGNVVISVNIFSYATYIPVHVKDLEVTNTTLTDSKGNIISVEPWHYEENQFWVLPGSFPPGEYKVELHFEGKLTEKIVGFYRSSYYDNSIDEIRNIATTKFEPVDARQAFPCFDEPALKAKFRISVIRPKDGYSALSNMDVEREVPGPGPTKVTVHFPETVPMSTYLVCFIVSDFKDSGAVMVNNKGKPFPVKIYSTVSQVPNTMLAKTSAAAVTKFYIDYFDIPYPLPKLDLIAIPDFVSGAMENWGLITFRETGLLFNEKENSAANKQRVVVVVSHEISHMWFGNLVTMKWWDDLWLNEGFASFMQYKGVDEGMPDCRDWQILDQAIHDQIHPVLLKDSVVTSHPIIQPVNNPNQITEIFDSISYNKGHAVIKMLEAFMGESNFQKGIQKYLKAHMFASASTPDLWAILNEEISSQGIDVGEVMDTWTRQMGYPLLTVKKTANAWVVTQERFLADGNATYNASESPYRYKWDIPIHYSKDKSFSGLVWLQRSADSLNIPRLTGENIIKLNHLQVGFYRVNYDEETWKAFDKVLRTKHTELHRKDRANLIDDIFNLAGAGKVNYALALDFTGYLKKEREFLPWATASSVLSSIISKFSSSIYYPGIRKYVRSLLKEMYGTKEMSWDVHLGDSHPHRQLRVQLLTLACRVALPAALDDAGKKFLEWIKIPQTNIHPDLKGLAIYYGMAAVGRELEWDVVWERYNKEQNPQQKISLLQTLAAIREPWILSRFIELAKNETYVRSQDYFQALGFISANPVGEPLVWDFFRNEWPYLVKRFTLYHRNLGTFISTVTNGFATQVKLEEIEAFYKKYPVAGAGEYARKQALEKVKQNINWLELNEEVIGKWLIKEKLIGVTEEEPAFIKTTKGKGPGKGKSN